MRRWISVAAVLAMAMAATLVGIARAESSQPQLTVTYYYLPG